MNFSLPKIIYFTASYTPTPSELYDAAELGVAVEFRNAMFVTDDSEPCDGVAGAIPAPYANKLKAKDAVKAYKADVKKQRDSMTDIGVPTANNLPDPDSAEWAKSNE